MSTHCKLRMCEHSAYRMSTHCKLRMCEHSAYRMFTHCKQTMFTQHHVNIGWFCTIHVEKCQYLTGGEIRSVTLYFIWTIHVQESFTVYRTVDGSLQIFPKKGFDGDEGWFGANTSDLSLDSSSPLTPHTFRLINFNWTFWMLYSSLILSNDITYIQVSMLNLIGLSVSYNFQKIDPDASTRPSSPLLDQRR